MKQNIKLKGRLRYYMYTPLYVTILLLFLNILIYFEDKRAGVIVTIFVVIYFIFIFTTNIFNFY